MEYRIIVDSACDLTKEMEKENNVLFVPFKIAVDGREFIDNDNFSKEDFLNTMQSSKNPIKTSCPSPYDYLEKLKTIEEDNIFIITISSKLSGSYNSAIVARDEFVENNPNKKVYVIDSKSASAGEVSLFLRLLNLLERDLSFEEVVSSIEREVDDNITFFVLESLENLIKNGRIKKTAGLIANVLNIRPIMLGSNGEISLYEMNRGFKRSISKLVKAIGKVTSDFDKKTLVISHVNALEKANDLKRQVMENYNFKEILIVPTKGLASGYADIGGIVIGF